MECSVLDIVLVGGRVAVLLLGMVAGMWCVWLGVRLYGDGVKSRSSGEVSFKSTRIVLTAASPGIFLALFGAGLMVSIVNRPLEMSDRQGVEGQKHAQARANLLEGLQSVPSQTTAKLIPTQASAADVEPRRCLVRERQRKLFSGNQTADAAAITTALTAGIDLAELESDRAAPGDRAAAYQRAAAILRELRSGVIR